MSLNPSSPPALPIDVVRAVRAPILVTGADGVLGRAVVNELVASQMPYREFVHAGSSSMPHLPHRFLGDISTGAGLDAALPGVSAVIHCASSARSPQEVDAAGTRNLLAALDAWAPEAHVVLVSTIGCWENPLAYYRAKADSENAVLGWPGRGSIVRSSLFHHTLRRVVSGRAAYITGATQDIDVTPVEAAWVATRLVDTAIMRVPLAQPLEVAGPETLTLGDAATLTAHIEARRPRRALSVPTGISALRPFQAGAHAPGPDVTRGGMEYGAWLASVMD